MTKLLDRTRTRTPRAGGVRARRSGHSPAPHWQQRAPRGPPAPDAGFAFSVLMPAARAQRSAHKARRLLLEW